MKIIDEHVLQHVFVRNLLIPVEVNLIDQQANFSFSIFLEEKDEEERVFFQIHQSPTKGFA